MRSWLLVSTILFTLFSCEEENVFYQNNQEIHDALWDKDDPVTFSFNIDDTTTKFEFYCDLRNTTSFEWSNLFLFIEMEAPDGLINIDTVEFPVAKVSGEWMGKKTGSLVENKWKFIQNLRFQKPGEYKISFAQGMRVDKLAEVVDVGLRIKKQKD